MSELLPDAGNAVSGWNTRNFYFYEIRDQVGADIHEVWIILAMLCSGLVEWLRKESLRMMTQ